MPASEAVKDKWFDEALGKTKIAEADVVKGALENFLHFEASSLEKVSVYTYFSKELLN